MNKNLRVLTPLVRDFAASREFLVFLRFKLAPAIHGTCERQIIIEERSFLEVYTKVSK